MSEAEDDPYQLDEYRLVNSIARGSVSSVWEAAEQASGRTVAIKLLKDDLPDKAAQKSLMKYEANAAKSFDHPTIIRFEKFVNHRDATYIVMEFFRALNVKMQIKGELASVHARARKFTEGVCQALMQLHDAGWIHRDFKPENVLMNKAGEVKLIDFSLASKGAGGLAKMLGMDRLKTIQGTRTYLAPETIRKQGPSPQTDMYSLGVTLFEVLTGKVPFQGSTPEDLLRKHLMEPPPNPSEFNSNVTPEMDRLVLKLMNKKPVDRYPDMQAVFSEIRRIRIFKADVEEQTAATRSERSNDELLEELNDLNINSRADAKRRDLLAANPELAKAYAEKLAAKQALKAKRAQASAGPGAAKPASPPPPPPTSRPSGPPVPGAAPPLSGSPPPPPRPAMPGGPPMPQAAPPIPGGPPARPPGYPAAPIPAGQPPAPGRQPPPPAGSAPPMPRPAPNYPGGPPPAPPAANRPPMPPPQSPGGLNDLPPVA